MFSEKLSYIMLITNTSNTELANALNVNQSLISKFKKGARIPSHNSDYIKQICEYLTKKINKSENKDEIITRLKIKDDLKSGLYNYFDELSNISPSFKENTNCIKLFYGDDGKKNASLNFLINALKYEKNALYLYSDENMSWMTKLKNNEEWSEGLVKLLKSNIKIKIIHSLDRNIFDLFDSVSFWLPLYLSGNIEAYYIPKLRDGITRRSIFVSNYDALISNSVNDKIGKMLNIYITDKEAVKALKEEFKNYLSISSPLFRKVVLNRNKYSNYKKYAKKTFGNMKTTIYVLNEKELVIEIPNSNYALKTNEPIMIRAFIEFLIKN